MQISDPPSLRLADDPLALAVKTVVDVMRTDFGDRFAKAFADAEQVRQLKRRLYAKLRGLAICDIYDGYDLLVESKPSFVPTVPEIVEAVLAAQKLRLKAEREAKQAEHAALSPPRPEVSETVAGANLKKIRELSGKAFADTDKSETGAEKAEGLARLADKAAAHRALLKQDFPELGRTYLAPSHECSVGFCRDPGTRAHGRGGNYYCAAHFRGDNAT